MPKPNISRAAQEFIDPSTEFLTKFRALVMSKAKDGDVNDEDLKAIFRAARGYAGGMGKAKRKAETVSVMSARETVEALIYAETQEKEHNGLFVGLWLAPEAASELAIKGGEAPEDLHVTLCYCGDVETLGGVTVARAITEAANLARFQAPLAGKVGGVGRFNASGTSDGQDVVYASVDMPGLVEFRTRLAECLTRAGAPPRMDHGFVPHITLAYIAPDAEMPTGVPSVNLRFDGLVVVEGDEMTPILFTGDQWREGYSDNLADICAKGGKMRLFIEQQFSTPPEWMPLLPKPGEFKHPEYGKITISKERNANFIANFQNGVYQSKLPINAEHVSSDAGAFGWIVGMRQNADDSVDAKVNWTDLGTEAIENDRFAYVSPEWVDTYKKNDGTKHSDVVLGAALTVRPFFKEDAMRPLVANESGLHFWSRPPSGDEANMTFYFTAATPITEVTMAIDKEARTKRFKEIAKSFKGELETHLKFMDAIAGDSEKPEEAEVFKAYVAREIELAKPVEEPKQFAELRAEVTRLATENKAKDETIRQATERVTIVEKDLRKKRFSDVAKSFSGPTDHVSMLEFIADHEEKGEDSERFKQYVEGQKALAEQLKASDLFRSIGDERGGEPKTAADELNALSQKYNEANPTLTPAQAYDHILAQNPALYNRHVEETRKGVN